jgi:hypothetical protein
MSSTVNTRATGARAQAREQERRLALGIDPKPEEITKICEQIQATWTKRERRLRGEEYCPVEAPSVRVLVSKGVYLE